MIDYARMTTRELHLQISSENGEIQSLLFKVADLQAEISRKARCVDNINRVIHLRGKAKGPDWKSVEQLEAQS